MLSNYPKDVLKLNDLIDGEHIDTVLEWLLMTFKESNALEFASIDNRVALIKALSDKSVTACLDNDRHMPD